jgi:ATP-binding cassette, subfamily B, multidrug efflux pump
MLDSAQSKIIYLASSMSAAATGDRIFVMVKGEIVPSDTHAKLVKQTGSQ